MMKKTLLIASLLLLTIYHLHAQGKFETTRDISYKTGSDYENERCKLDIHSPEAAGSYPVVIWFHGGGLTGGNKYFPGELLQANIVLVAVNYRLSPKVRVREIIDDAAAATAWVFEHIEDYKGNPEQIIVTGHSAGGYLTMMIGLDNQWLGKYKVDSNDIHALFPFSGHTITHLTVRKEQGLPQTLPLVDEMAPLYHVKKDAPPLYLLTGDRELEMLGRYEENAYMWRMMKVNGNENCFLYEFDGHDHGAMVAPGCHVLLEFIKSMK